MIWLQNWTNKTTQILYGRFKFQNPFSLWKIHSDMNGDYKHLKRGIPRVSRMIAIGS